jgi:hypothetical protein
MRANRDAKTADDEDPGEVDAGQPAEDEGEPGERLARHPRVVRDREEQGRRRDRQAARQHGRRLQEPQDPKKQRHQREPEERLLVHPRAEEPDQRRARVRRARRQDRRQRPLQAREPEIDQLAQDDQGDGQDHALDHHPEQRGRRESPVARIDGLPDQKADDQAQGEEPLVG